MIAALAPLGAALLLLLVGALVYGLVDLERVEWQASVDRREQEQRAAFTKAMRS